MVLPWLCFAMTAMGQMAEKGKGTIVGAIADEVSNGPIEFATISLHQLPDSALLTGTITDQEGKFVLTEIQEGKYFVRMDFIGYTRYESPMVEISSENLFIDMGSVALASSTVGLGEVEVAADKNLMETRIDKRIFNVEKSITAEGGNGLDVLRNVPSVDVDQDNNISLRGDQGVTILVDGRPSALPAAQLLQQLPSSAIERIEVITNPSAKYDPEGLSGILNIVLKKNLNRGFNGYLSSSFGYGKFSKVNNSIGINYRTPKLNLSASYMMYRGKFWFGGDTWRQYELGDTTVTQYSEDDGWYDTNMHGPTVGLDYYINDKHTLYTKVMRQTNQGHGNRDLHFEFLNGEEVLSQSDRMGVNENPNALSQYNAGWAAQFSSPQHTFDLDIDFQDGYNNGAETIREDFLFADQTVADPVMQRTQLDRIRRQLYIRNDYVHPFNDSTTLELGVHSTTRWMDDLFAAWSYDHPTAAYQYDTAAANTFTYMQQVWAAYSTFGLQRGQWGAKVGLRAEQTVTDAELVTTRETFENDYFALFPSMHLSYKLSPTHELQASYGRRINRPVTDQLNPFYTYDDPYTIQTGNPFLQPEFIDVYEVGYVGYMKKLNINANVYYRQIHDMFRRYLDLNEQGQSVVSFQNLAVGHLTGTELIVGVNPTERWRNNLTFNYWQAQIDDPTVDEGTNTTNKGYSLQFTSSYQFKGGLSAQVSSNYNGRMQVLQGIIKPRGGIDIALRKQILKKRGSLSVRASDLLGTRNFTFESANIPNQNFNSHRQWESQQVNITFNYSFGKMQFQPKRRNQKDNSSGDTYNAGDMQ